MYFYFQEQKSYSDNVHTAGSIEFEKRHFNCTSEILHVLAAQAPLKENKKRSEAYTDDVLGIKPKWRYLLARLSGDFVRCRTTRT